MSAALILSLPPLAGCRRPLRWGAKDLAAIALSLHEKELAGDIESEWLPSPYTRSQYQRFSTWRSTLGVDPTLPSQDAEKIRRRREQALSFAVRSEGTVDKVLSIGWVDELARRVDLVPAKDRAALAAVSKAALILAGRLERLRVRHPVSSALIGHNFDNDRPLADILRELAVVTAQTGKRVGRKKDVTRAGLLVTGLAFDWIDSFGVQPRFRATRTAFKSAAQCVFSRIPVALCSEGHALEMPGVSVFRSAVFAALDAAPGSVFDPYLYTEDR